MNDIANTNDFVASIKNRNNSGEMPDDLVDYQKLNENQKKVFKQVKVHYQNILMDHQIEPLRIMVIGTTRTRKLYLIQTI